MRDFAVTLARELGSDHAAANAALKMLIHRERGCRVLCGGGVPIRGDRTGAPWLDRLEQPPFGVALLLSILYPALQGRSALYRILQKGWFTNPSGG